MLFYYWLIFKIIILASFKLGTTKSIENLNNLRDQEHKCIIEVQNDYLKNNRNYTIISEDSNKNNDSVSKILVCCDGYERSKYDSEKCVPICPNCNHGICLGPGVCECYPHYIKNHEGKCVLTCPVACYNGRCKVDGTCKCNEGYILDDSEKFCIPHCSDNYRYNCKDNAYCSAPNTCSCIEGYKFSKSNCVPICKNDCGINGTCIEPNVCKCFNQAILIDGICQDRCFQKCQNGICKAPNHCVCFPGYTYDRKTTSCIPDLVLRKINIEDLD